MKFESIEQIKALSHKHLVLCFAGVGSAFTEKNNNTSLIIAKNGKTVLVDIGYNVPAILAEKSVPITSFDYYHLTHSHSDHIGGSEKLFFLSRYVTKTKPKLIITESYQDILWEKSLKGGMEHSETGLLKFTDFVEIVRPTWVKAQPREMYDVLLDGDLKLTLFRTAHIPGFVDSWSHAFWSNGLIIDDKVLFTGDTRFDPMLFKDVNVKNIVEVFHDCQLFNPGSVHASLDELDILSPELKSKMLLTHYGDNFDKFNVKEKGFKGFAEAWEIYRY